MKKIIVIKIIVVAFFGLIFSLSVSSNSYAGDAPITYINFTNGIYDDEYNCYIYTGNRYWTFTAPSGSYISYVSYGKVKYINSNYFEFKIDDELYYSESNNHYSSPHYISDGQTVTNINATSIKFKGGDIYFRGLIIGLKYAIPDESLVISAKNAANSAKSYASAAKSSADTAASRSYYNGNSSGYWSYNAYSKANSANINAASAKTEAINAKNEAAAAKSSADTAASRSYYNGNSSGYWSYNAYSEANSANSNAVIAASRVWDSAESKSAATLAKEARDKANTIDNKLAYLENKLINIENNILATDSTAPTLISVGGLNGATCTTTSSYTLYVNCSDNGPDSNLRYRVECGSFDSGWVSSNTITITGLSQGAKTAKVKVSDNPTSPEDGNITQVSYTFFKI